ncbi:hypothetical protein GDO78_004918 [Eleutherodactylus coqui]|uniref:Uncharacterized protein n=1 Tax=Eleutherodactylus coqui TaxID=57060 RepID=A0A8J6KGX8_ELECQ|nr:hypothetical protein GDO78_004918 [Eleutherodactylus coqui]
MGLYSLKGTMTLKSGTFLYLLYFVSQLLFNFLFTTTTMIRGKKKGGGPPKLTFFSVAISSHTDIANTNDCAILTISHNSPPQASSKTVKFKT